MKLFPSARSLLKRNLRKSLKLLSLHFYGFCSSTSSSAGFVFSSIPKLCRLVMVIFVLPELTVALWTKPCKAHCSEPPTWTCSAPSIFGTGFHLPLAMSMTSRPWLLWKELKSVCGCSSSPTSLVCFRNWVSSFLLLNLCFIEENAFVLRRVCREVQPLINLYL